MMAPPWHVPVCAVSWMGFDWVLTLDACSLETPCSSCCFAYHAQLMWSYDVTVHVLLIVFDDFEKQEIRHAHWESP